MVSTTIIIHYLLGNCTLVCHMQTMSCVGLTSNIITAKYSSQKYLYNQISVSNCGIIITDS